MFWAKTLNLVNKIEIYKPGSTNELFGTVRAVRTVRPILKIQVFGVRPIWLFLTVRCSYCSIDLPVWTVHCSNSPNTRTAYTNCSDFGGPWFQGPLVRLLKTWKFWSGIDRSSDHSWRSIDLGPLVTWSYGQKNLDNFRPFVRRTPTNSYLFIFICFLISFWNRQSRTGWNQQYQNRHKVLRHFYIFKIWI